MAKVSKITSKEMVDRLYEKVGFAYFDSKSQLKRFLDDFGKFLSTTVAEEHIELKLPNFGTFKLSYLKGKTMNSPLNEGKEVTVKPRYKIRFKPLKKVKDSLIDE